MVTTVIAWDHATALRVYRQTAARISAAWSAMDVFDKPSLHRRDILAADAAIQTAFKRQDTAAVTAACGRWERAICGGTR